MPAAPLRQLVYFVPIYLISPLLPVKFMPPSRFIFQLRFLLKIRLSLFGKRLLNKDGSAPPMEFPPGS